MQLNRELFKDDKAYEKYLQSFGELKGSTKVVARHCIDLEEKFDYLIRSEEDAIYDLLIKANNRKFMNYFLKIIFTLSQIY